MTVERVVRRWYQCFLADGTLWCESSDPDEVRERRPRGRECTFQVVEVVQYERVAPWDGEVVT